MTCDDAEEIFLELEDDPTSDEGRRSLLNEHLCECAPCRARCESTLKTLRLAARCSSIPLPEGRFWINYPALVRMRILERRRARRAASFWGAAAACAAGVAIVVLFWSFPPNRRLDNYGSAHSPVGETASHQGVATVSAHTGFSRVAAEGAMEAGQSSPAPASDAIVAVAFTGRKRSFTTSDTRAVPRANARDDRAGSPDDPLFTPAVDSSLPEGQSVEDEIVILVDGESSLGEIESLLDIYEHERGVPDGMDYREEPELWEETDAIAEDAHS